MKRAPYLRKGQRFLDEGKLWEVERVTECSATVVEVHVKPQHVEFGDRSFMARKGKRKQISPTALVKVVEEVA